MITVRFPTGFSIQYNSLHAQKWGSDGTQMLFKSVADRDAGNGWSVLVPAGCVVEFTAPCRTYNPIATDSDKVQASIEALAKEIRSLKRKVGKP